MLEALTLYWPSLVAAYVLYVLGMLSPGPNILSIVATSMSAGRRAGKAQALGIATGTFMWGITSWLGLTAILTTYAGALTAIKIFGGLFLLWLAYRAFRSAASREQPPVVGAAAGRPTLSYYRRGLLVQMTNPKAALWWTAVMALAIGDHAPVWVGGVIVLITTITSIAGHLTYAVLFSTKRFVSAYRRGRRWIDGALGAFFSFASFELLTARV